MMNAPAPRITPVLPSGEGAGFASGTELRFHDQWTEALTRTYGGGVLQGPMARRSAQGPDAFLAPLRTVWPRSWRLLKDQHLSVRFLEKRHLVDETWAAGGFWSLFQLPNSFVTFASWWDGHVPSPFPPEVTLVDFRSRVARLPGFLADLYRDFCEISLHDTSPYPQLPDLSMLNGMPYGAFRLRTLVGRRKVPAALKAFRDLDDLKIITHKNGGLDFEFLLFFDDGEAGDGRVFAALHGSLQDIFVVPDPRDTMDRMFAHHLAGTSQPFDLRASLAPLSHGAAG